MSVIYRHIVRQRGRLSTLVKERADRENEWGKYKQDEKLCEEKSEALYESERKTE